MMGFLPQSLFGRLLVLLLGGLILAQLLSAGIQLYDRGQVLQRAVGLHVARRIAAIVELLDRLPDPERRRLVTALDLPPTRISLNIPWQELDSDHRQHAALLAALLRRRLSVDRPLRVAVFDIGLSGESKQSPIPPPYPRPYRRRPPWALGVKAFQVQVVLTDSSVVTFRHRVPEEVFAWPYRLLVILLVLLLSVALLAILAARWLTRPLALLATAAMDLGRDIHRPPLRERGPLEVRRAAQAFNTMQARLIRYIRDRSRILAAVSHDLKTPITRLRLRTELLEDTELREKFQADLDEMESMVQATLDFMRGTENSEPVAPIDIDALLESLQEDVTDAGGQLSIQGSIRTPYQGRPLALKRCLTNLIDNALNYGKRATICVDDKRDYLTLTVSDEGPGIPEEELERVFEPFYRLEGSRSRHTGGTGLGLGIARNIARSHGGELTLHNTSHGGLGAEVRLPR